MELYMMNRHHGRMILEFVENGPLLWPKVEENGVTRPKKYSKLSATEAIQADCDVKETNIILQGLPPEYGSHAQSLTPLSITYPSNNFQSLVHHNVYNPSSSIPQVAYAPSVHQQSDFSQPDTSLIVLVFQKGDDPIDAINHMMSFLNAIVTSRYPPTNNQLRNSSNPQQQTTINNGRVTVQPIQGRQNSLDAGTSRPYTSGPSGNNSGKQRTVSVINVKEKDTCQSNAQSQRGKGMRHGLRIRCSWSKLKQMDKFFMRRIRNFWQTQGLQKLKPHSFETRFVPQTELSAEQVFWSQNLDNSDEPNLSTRPTIVEVPNELLKVSMVNSSLKKLKFHLVSFDVDVEQLRVKTNRSQDKMKEVVNDNERLLEQAISKDIVNIVVTANVNYPYEFVNECERCVTLETELQKDFIKKEVNLPTSASGSKPPRNIKKDRIQQRQSRAKKNKLEAYPRNVRTSLHNKKSVVNTKDIASVQNSKLNVNSDL
nr:hypothetical protein [Tanacetum cinerariifolium]